MIDVSQFSSMKQVLSRTLCVMRTMLTFKSLLDNGTRELDLSPDALKCRAYNFIRKQMQAVHFGKVINFLSDQNAYRKDTPNIVLQLYLFLEDKGLLRSKGSMGECVSLQYDVINPILCYPLRLSLN